ncbi:AGAP006211-PA-like protein [Anopheles sinensis]|uniref:AGAP006211-PA-like protein n=1 Tax=Anopheles sinensis TaxID=74873 RepID=A0A084WK15_ANOSI|nr:AGAP006211-PA-like protein [Anopheles sinensis]
MTSATPHVAGPRDSSSPPSSNRVSRGVFVFADHSSIGRNGVSSGFEFHFHQFSLFTVELTISNWQSVSSGHEHPVPTTDYKPARVESENHTPYGPPCGGFQGNEGSSPPLEGFHSDSYLSLLVSKKNERIKTGILVSSLDKDDKEEKKQVPSLKGQSLQRSRNGNSKPIRTLSLASMPSPLSLHRSFWNVPETQSQATLGSPEGLQTASSNEDISSMTDAAIACNGKVDSSVLHANGFVNGGMNAPGLKETNPPRACIMTALSIDTKSNSDALKMVTSTMGITLTNGATVTAVTQ